MPPLVDKLLTVIGGARARRAVPWSCTHAVWTAEPTERNDHELQRTARRPQEEAGLSHEQLGYELGVSRQTVSKWELGQSYPDFQRLVLLSDYYEISLDELVRGVDVGDVRALNESEKQISSIYSDVERGKEAALRAWRAFLVVAASSWRSSPWWWPTGYSAGGSS